MKTIKTWLNKLDEPYKTEAIINTQNVLLSIKSESLSAALSGAFSWEKSKQGHEYWEELNEKIKDENR